MREHGDELAGIIVEPFQRLIAPKPGFLEGLRRITEENGLVLIFDEVVTVSVSPTAVRRSTMA